MAKQWISFLSVLLLVSMNVHAMEYTLEDLAQEGIIQRNMQENGDLDVVYYSLCPNSEWRLMYRPPHECEKHNNKNNKYEKHVKYPPALGLFRIARRESKEDGSVQRLIGLLRLEEYEAMKAEELADHRGARLNDVEHTELLSRMKEFNRKFAVREER